MLRGTLAFTTQERSQNVGEGFWDDLFKKWTSGGGIFGRMPYAVVTTMVNLVGWNLAGPMRSQARRVPSARAGFCSKPPLNFMLFDSANSVLMLPMSSCSIAATLRGSGPSAQTVISSAWSLPLRFGVVAQ